MANNTPSANRLHVGFFGRTNSGKSSLINALAGQTVAIVSNVPGTTTDPVHKAMELHGVGAATLIDTAGFDDASELGALRIEQTEKALQRCDVAVLLFDDIDISKELEWYKKLRDAAKPVVCAITRSDARDPEPVAAAARNACGEECIILSASDKGGVERLRSAIVRAVPEDWGQRSITAGLAEDGDLVLLVAPQDIQAPTGRLILPQVQTIRDLLDKKCLVVVITTDKLDAALAALSRPPKLIIADSQVFRTVWEKKPVQSLLTSFSVLFAAYKGDIDYYVAGAKAIDALTEHSRVLIAECCTHAPLTEDIGRVKIPRLLRNRAGEGLTVDVVSGTDYPEDLTKYDLIIQCGACMFNRGYVTSRIDRAKTQRVPMTNYGVALAYLNGILDKISLGIE
ncbi:MAG: [FeFe] hydrogenase H-cluster maturation GTPase HydF [Christensenellales bacterium]|jgi:[FeFe] hydrogenase H-cluster maturation GTPase HydF